MRSLTVGPLSAFPAAALHGLGQKPFPVWLPKISELEVKQLSLEPCVYKAHSLLLIDMLFAPSSLYSSYQS